MSHSSLITPDWPAPGNVKAYASTRMGGVSSAPYDTFNLGPRCGDQPEAVTANQNRLCHELGSVQPVWLKQVHGCRVVDASDVVTNREADGLVTREKGVLCSILTADCVPVLLCDANGNQVAAVHAGWRGLAQRILDVAVQRFVSPARDLMAWIGPAISQRAYEVDQTVFDGVTESSPDCRGCFESHRPGHWLADLPAIAAQQLRSAGVDQVYLSGLCTFHQPDLFFSYRRDRVCGRQATGIWLE